MALNKYEIDMTHGPVLGKILKMSIPLMLTGILQLIYNAADVIVVGQFADETSLGAVGSTTALIHLLVNLFIGISMGSGVVVAQYIGSASKKMVEKSVHTSIGLSFVIGIAVGILGFFVCKPILVLMQTPADVLPKAVTYLKIYFLGLPGLMVYDFCSSILNSTGDTKRPLYILSITGIVNIVLNLILVINFKLDVAGVAIATIVAQYLSAICVLYLLIHTNADYKFSFKKLHIYKNILIQILKYGVPTGLQSALFSLSNVIIQSSINSFGSIAVAGNSAASSVEGFIFTVTDAPSKVALTFTSQNIGAGKKERVNKVLLSSVFVSAVFTTVLSLIINIFSKEFLSIFSSKSDVISVGVERIAVLGIAYVFCGVMNVIANTVRGMGYSVTPMLITLLFVCVMRVVWIYTVFAYFGTLESIYYSYPISWILACICHFIVFLVVRKKPKVSV